jgi:hypothetical protein
MTTTPIAKAPDDVFGYTAAFEEALKKIGQISPQEFAKRYASRATYLSQISWDPTTAGYWDEFNLDPQEHNKNPNRKNWRSYDFRLNSEELAVFKKNGFVVSERMGSYSFANLFYRIYSNDLPVFISADALLHAWHRSYDAILSELEESYLACALDEIFKGMVERIPDAWKQYGDGVLGESVRDADYFLVVARSLLGQAELSPQEWQNWICPDLNSTWKFKSGFLINQEETHSVYLSGDKGYPHALKYFTGQFTLKQVQDLCRQQLGNAISPTFVEGLLEELFANDVLARPTKAVTTYLNQDNRVAETIVAIASEQLQRFNLFGRDRKIEFFKNFAQQLAILKGIAIKQLAQEELDLEEATFLRDIVEIESGSGYTRYNGWYPKLFYKGEGDSNKQDAIVADVHTDVPSDTPPDPGCVLHQGVGNVDLLMIAVDNGEDKIVYAGPVLSHYEFERPGVSRQSDSEWFNGLKNGKVPPRPDWTKSYLVTQ